MENDLFQAIIQIIVDKSQAKNQLNDTLNEFNNEAKKRGIEIPTNIKPSDIKSATKEFDKLTTSTKKANKEVSDIKHTTFENTVSAWKRVNTAGHSYYKTLDDIVERSKYINNPAEFKNIETEYRSIIAQAKAAGKVGKSLTATFTAGVQKFGSWIVSSGTVMEVVSGIKAMVSSVHEVNDALTNISYTMDVTDKQLEKIGSSSLQMAKDLNTGASNVLGAVKLYANANETAESILSKAEPAVYLSNVTDWSGEEAAKNLQSMMNQFDLTQDDLLEMSDTLENISSRIAYDFSDGIKQISEGVSEAGSVARTAGLDFNDFGSMIAVLVERTGQSGSQLANSLKTIITRTTKASSVMGIDEGDISKAESALRSVNIEVRKSDGEFREFDDTMSDLAKKWDTLSDVSKSELSFQLAGTRQVNVLQSLMRGWDEYRELVASASESDGTTLANQDKYAESLTGKLGELSATWESIANETIESDFLKGLVSAGTAVSSLVEKFGLLNTVLVAGGGVLGAKNMGKRIQAYTFQSLLLF